MDELLEKIVKHLDMYGYTYRKNHWTAKQVAGALKTAYEPEIENLGLADVSKTALAEEYNRGYHDGCEDMQETYELNKG